MATKTGFLDRIARTPLVFDGAMGTMIYERGVFINACYDELCLTRPELILTIHQEYVEAGADVIESNTFGANRMKLAAFGLADKVEAINRAGIRLARKAAGDDVLVAASVQAVNKTSNASQRVAARLRFVEGACIMQGKGRRCVR